MSATFKTERQQLRKQLRAARNALSASEQQQASEALCSQLSGILPVSLHRIAGYLANDGEITLQPTLDYCFRKNIAVSLPVLHPFTGKHLLFQDYHQQTPMALNRFGISEPGLDCTAIRLLQMHDCLLMPLVGFDAQGNRLGMGGGFYDRTLATLTQQNTSPLLIGVAHDCQQVATLPIEPWDIPLDMIITPTQIIRTPTGKI